MSLQSGCSLQAGKYRIESVLGQGGFGVTYRGVQVALERPVAIKEFFMKEYCERDEATSHVTLGSQGSRELVERFRQKFIKEARLIAALKNPHIINIYDIFEENGTAYYVMDYIDGGSLKDEVARRGALPEEEALTYVRQIGEALGYVHARKILHLDVKPANVLLSDDKVAVLIDFGISKRYDESGSQTSSAPVGISKGFAPLEQYAQGGVSGFAPCTDIYSLGATLYYLVTGNTPPEANELYDEGFPPFPPHLSASTVKAIRWAMQPRRKERPQSVDEFLSAWSENSVATSCHVDGETTAVLSPQEETLLASGVSAPVGKPRSEKNTVISEDEETIFSQPQSKKALLEKKEISLSDGEEKPKGKTGIGVWGGILLVVLLAIGIFMAVNRQSATPLAEAVAREEAEPQPDTRFYTDYSLLQVGDYYYADGSFSHAPNGDKTCVGVVFSLETTQAEQEHGWTHGQAMALADAENGDRIRWEDVGDGEMSELNCRNLPAPHTSYRDGQGAEVLADCNGYVYTYSGYTNGKRFPAFEAAKNYPVTLPEGKTSGWYLPALGQMARIFQNIGKIEITVNSEGEIMVQDNGHNMDYIGKFGFQSGVPYWSSTEGVSSGEYPLNLAWEITPNGSAYGGVKNSIRNDDLEAVRPVFAF